MLDKLGTLLYPQIFVNIIYNSTGISIHIEKYKKSISIESVDQKFSATTIESEIKEYLKSYTKDTPYFYTSLLDFSSSQGAIPTCVDSQKQLYYDKSISKDLCYQDKWSFYTSKFDLDDIQRSYRDLGLDFIFSPVVILAKFFKDKIVDHFAMYILIQDSYVTLGIFDNGELLYANHVDVGHMEKDELSMDDNIEEVRLDDDDDDGSIDLEDVDVGDDLDDLDGFGDIEDLDSIEEIDEFSDVAEEEDDEDDFGFGEGEDFSSPNEEDFNQDYQRFIAIQDSVKRYYEDDRYNGKFIEHVYIADSSGINDDLKSYLEEEMFLHVYIRHIQIGLIMSELALEELA